MALGTIDPEKSAIDPEDFLAAIERLRMTEGYSVDELGEITRTPRRTLFNWITGGVVPPYFRRLDFLRTMADPLTPLSASKLSAHHLTFDKGKRRWICRITVDMGQKVVGKRIRVNLKAEHARDAIRERDAVVRTCEALGLQVRPRIQRKGGEA